MGQNKDADYKQYRKEYLKNLGSAQFPWACAYYYYMQNINRIDVMSYTDFKHKLTQVQVNIAGKQLQDKVYDTLDAYFHITFLVDNNNQVQGAF